MIHGDSRRAALERWLATYFQGARFSLAPASEDASFRRYFRATLGDGRSYIAANLAVLFAQLGERTLLIDADLRFPRQHRIFRLMAGRGLAHALYARGMNGDAEKVPYFENLFVLSAGAVPPNPSELVSRPGLGTLLEEAARRYAVVLIDTPAWVRGSDAQLVATRAGGALLVARHNRTRLGALRQLQDAIVRGGAQIAGSVLNST